MSKRENQKLMERIAEDTKSLRESRSSTASQATFSDSHLTTAISPNSNSERNFGDFHHSRAPPSTSKLPAHRGSLRVTTNGSTKSHPEDGGGYAIARSVFEEEYEGK